MRRWLAGLLLCAGVVCAACGSDDKPRLKGYGFACQKSSQCAANLTCRFSRCRQVCENDSDCDDGACLKAASYDKGVCALTDEQACTDTSCAFGLACSSDATCRPECQSASDCTSPDSCSAGACAPP